METIIREVQQGDWIAITEIFNHFVRESLAAYPDEPVADDFFRKKHEESAEHPFLVAEAGGVVTGFAYLSAFHPASTMSRSAVLTYFIHPDHTGKRLGSLFLNRLLEVGRLMGVKNFLAHISSANEGSVRFHARHGFIECGRFLSVGEKHGQNFDMVWMQRIEDGE